MSSPRSRSHEKAATQELHIRLKHIEKAIRSIEALQRMAGKVPSICSWSGEGAVAGTGDRRDAWQIF